MAAPQVILLPGVVLPASLSYGPLLEALHGEADAVAKDLELYAGSEPPPGYSMRDEVDGLLRLASAQGFDTFHLVGYSGGGAVCLLAVATWPERIRSLALIEPAWAGNRHRSAEERAAWRELDGIVRLAPEEMLPAFVRRSLRRGVPPPEPAPGNPPPWMAQRPAGIRAMTAAFARAELEPAVLERFDRPVYIAIGELSDPAMYAAPAARLCRTLPDCKLEFYAERHHFDPPHRMEAQRFAAALRALWARAQRA